MGYCLLEEEMDKIDRAIERIKTFEPEDGYHGAFSGGKDSVVLLDLVTLAGVKVDWHFNKTTVDPPEVVNFIRSEFPQVAIDQPDITMWKLIVKKIFPPTRRIRYCCEYLKERGGKGRHVLTGIRAEESARRAKRQMVEHCYRHVGKVFVNPIIDFTEADVWKYTAIRGLPVCSLYGRQKRIGCVGCPMAGVKQRKADFERYPGYYKAYLRAFENMLEERERKGKETSWKSAEEVMAWWLSA